MLYTCGSVTDTEEKNRHLNICKRADIQRMWKVRKGRMLQAKEWVSNASGISLTAQAHVII
jgi:hypothetical protein